LDEKEWSYGIVVVVVVVAEAAQRKVEPLEL
jgi:hypothetical protein